MTRPPPNTLTPEEHAFLHAEADGYLSKCTPYLRRQQRERRAARPRIDYTPSERVHRILFELGGSYSATLDRIVEEWQELRQRRRK